MLDVIGKSKNIDLFWKVLYEIGNRGLVIDKTWRIAMRTLASERELKKCVEPFHLMSGFGWGYDLEVLNKGVEKAKLVVEAEYVVRKMKDSIKANEVTYGCLICGFCGVGDLVEASKVWDLMVDEGFEPGIDAVEKMMETLFKNNRF